MNIFSLAQEILKHIRLPQFFFFVAMFVVGTHTALYTAQMPDQLVTQLHILVPITVLGMLIAYLLWAASCMTNDIYDIAIDQMTNTQRPLARGIVSVRTYHILATWANLGALLLSSLLGIYAAYWCAAFIVINYAYNMPPFRLKRIIFIGPFLGALSLQIVLFMGFYAITHFYALSIAYPYPLWQTLLAALLVSFVIPLKDLKDIPSDHAYGVRTLPGLIGARNTIRIAGISISIGMFIPLFITQMFTWTHALPIALIALMSIVIIEHVSVNGRAIRPHKVLAWLLIPMLCYFITLLMIFL